MVSRYRVSHINPAALAAMPLYAAVAWLRAEDPNGAYTSEESRAEGLAPLSADEARHLVADMLVESGDWNEVDRNALAACLYRGQE